MKVTDKLKAKHTEIQILYDKLSYSRTRPIEDIIKKIIDYEKYDDNFIDKSIDDFKELVTAFTRKQQKDYISINNTINNINKEIDFIIDSNFGHYAKLSYMVLDKYEVDNTVEYAIAPYTIHSIAVKPMTSNGNSASYYSNFVINIDKVVSTINSISVNVASTIDIVMPRSMGINDLENLERIITLWDH